MNLEVGKQYNVTVTQILPVGAVVELEDKTTELVHISNIANCYIANIADFVSIGNQYVATCESGTKKPLVLSFKSLNLKSTNYKPKPPRSSKLNNQPKHKSIDDMIADANLQYAGKQTKYEKRNKRR